MPFIPRQYEQILDDMINHVKVNTGLTDFNRGSVIRTLLEAAAIEDDDQYFQMVQLLSAFSIKTAVGEDLDARLSDFDLYRLSPKSSSGEVIFSDGDLITNFLSSDAAVAATSVVLQDTTAFPATPPNFKIRIGEGTTEVEDTTVTDSITTPNTFVLASPGLVNSHSAGERVSIVSGVPASVISAGVQVKTKATAISVSTAFISTTNGSIEDGNYNSNSVSVKALSQGSHTNVAAGTITQFSGGAPIPGLTVTNPSGCAGGRDTETDDEFRDRALSSLQSLSRGTVKTLRSSIIGIEDSVSGKRVISSGLTEDFENNEVIVYIDDGSGLVPTTQSFASSSLSADFGVGASTLTVANASLFPSEGDILVETTTSDIEFFHYNNRTGNTITVSTTAAKNHLVGDDVILVEVVTESAEDGQKFFKMKNYPMQRNQVRLWARNKAPGSTFVLKTDGVDYFLNRGNGQLEFFGSGLDEGTTLVSSYTFYTGLIQVVQKVIEGDPDDPISFPGLKAAGVVVAVEAPTTRTIDFRANLAAMDGFLESDLYPLAKETIEDYIKTLGIGNDFILSEAIARIMAISGVFDVFVSSPTGNLTVLENEIPIVGDITVV